MILLAIGVIMALAVIIGVLVRLFSLSSRSGASPLESEEEILERSLAEGEIDLDEYTRRSAALPKTKRSD